MKKVLFVATVDSHIRHFHIPYLQYFYEKGYEVHVATANDEEESFPYCHQKHTISFARSPWNVNNLKAIRQMKQLLKQEHFDLVHCHTPMGGVVTRIAAKATRKQGTKVFYTAHGFHFYQGAPLRNWLLYYPVEKWLSKDTDVLITINDEDYEYAKAFKAKRVEKIDGIGVDETRFQISLSEAEKEQLRKEFGLRKKDIVLTYVAELISRKHQDLVIEAMKEITKQHKNVKLLLVGTGEKEESYQKQIQELHLENYVKLTGYRKDVPNIFQITDIAISTSRQEGLGLNLIEALFSRVPVVASYVRGHNEIVEEGKNGYFYRTKKELVEKLEKLIENPTLRKQLQQNAVSSVQRFTLTNSLQKGIAIYESEGI